MKTGALKQRKNATATIRSGNDDCRDVRKISISQRHHAAMRRSRDTTSLLAAIFIDFISANPFREVRIPDKVENPAHEIWVKLVTSSDRQTSVKAETL
ncbi:hypothetical protein ACULNC_10290 [Shigella flexneri]